MPETVSSGVSATLFHSPIRLVLMGLQSNVFSATNLEPLHTLTGYEEFQLHLKNETAW